MNYNIPLVLDFVYNRLLNVYNENPNLDWMIRFKSSIEDIKGLANNSNGLLEIITIQREIITKTEQLLDIYKKDNEQYQKLEVMYNEVLELTKKIQFSEYITANLLIAHARDPKNR